MKLVSMSRAEIGRQRLDWQKMYRDYFNSDLSSKATVQFEVESMRIGRPVFLGSIRIILAWTNRK
jgi:hypothetical protein